MEQVQDYYCKETCFHANKRFKVGQIFPPDWVANGIKPNSHFVQMSAEQAKQIAKMAQEELKKKAPQSAGEDRRSTAELKAALLKAGGMKSIPDSWSRKIIWQKLYEIEHLNAKSA